MEMFIAATIAIMLMVFWLIATLATLAIYVGLPIVVMWGIYRIVKQLTK